jgi:hypothetical protein
MLQPRVLCSFDGTGDAPLTQTAGDDVGVVPRVCPDRSVAASVVWRWWRRWGVVAIIGRRRVEMGAPRMRAVPAPVRAPPSVMPTTMPRSVPTISLPLSAVRITPALGLGRGGVKSRSCGEGDEHRTHQNVAYPSHGSILRPLATAGIAASGPASTSSWTMAAIWREEDRTRNADDQARSLRRRSLASHSFSCDRQGRGS